MEPETIAVSDFNTAVAAAIQAVKPKLNALKKLLTTDDQKAAEKALHDELVTQLQAADALANTGGVHALDGTGGKPS